MNAIKQTWIQQLKVAEKLNISNEHSDKKGRHTTQKMKIKESWRKWESKVMHEQYIRSISIQLISEEDSFLWL